MQKDEDLFDDGPITAQPAKHQPAPALPEEESAVAVNVVKKKSYSGFLIFIVTFSLIVLSLRSGAIGDFWYHTHKGSKDHELSLTILDPESKCGSLKSAEYPRSVKIAECARRYPKTITFTPGTRYQYELASHLLKTDLVPYNNQGAYRSARAGTLAQNVEADFYAYQISDDYKRYRRVIVTINRSACAVDRSCGMGIYEID